MQTPTLAILARREEEIRAFMPEPYWLVDASFEAARRRARGRYHGPLHAGAQAAPRDGARRPTRSSPPCAGSAGDDHQAREDEARESAPLLYDLTSLQREANTRFGFSARRTLAAAQRLYEEHKALTYPRTSSRYLTERHGRRRSSRSPRSSAGTREYARRAPRT